MPTMTIPPDHRYLKSRLVYRLSYLSQNHLLYGKRFTEKHKRNHNSHSLSHGSHGDSSKGSSGPYQSQYHLDSQIPSDRENKCIAIGCIGLLK